MNSNCCAYRLTVALCLLLLGSVSARANVYATDIKFNGFTNNAALVPGGSCAISYVLNEPATEGVSLQIFSGSNLVQTIKTRSTGTEPPT